MLLKRGAVIVFVVLGILSSPGQPNLPPPINPATPVPISGIELLLGGGLMAGLYSHFRRRSKDTDS